MRYIKYGLGVILALLMTACSHWHSSQDQTRFVKYAATLPPIVVPPGIKNPTAESYYPIPPIALTAPIGTQPPLTPPGSLIVRQKTGVKLPAPSKSS